MLKIKDIMTLEELNNLQDYYVNKGLQQWLKYGKLIIGVDFDETILPYRDYEEKICNQVVSTVLEAQKLGAIIILYTCRDDKLLDEAIHYCEEKGLKFHAVNPIGSEEFLGEGWSSKPYFNIQLDDKAGLISAVTTLQEIIIKYKENETRNK